MEQQVIARDRQRVLHTDTMDMQKYMRETFDELIRQAVGPGDYYSGFATSKTATYELTIGAGRTYVNGAMYQRTVSTVLAEEINNVRPTAQKKYVAIVGWGSEIETTPSGAAAENRQFIVNTTTRETEIQNVSTRTRRQVNIGIVAGAETAQPTMPAIGVGNVLIAKVLLNNAEIETVEMNADALLPQLARQLVQIVDMYSWREDLGAVLDTVRTDVAGINSRLNSFVPLSAFLAHLREFDEYKDATNQALELALQHDSVSPSFLFQEQETFANEGLTDKNGAGYTARIDRGLRFDYGASDTDGKLELINPFDPKLKITDDFALPNWTPKPRLSTWKPGLTLDASLNAFTNVTVSTKVGKKPIYTQKTGDQHIMYVTHKFYNRNYMGAAQSIQRNGTTYYLVDNEVLMSTRVATPDGEEYVQSQLVYEAASVNIITGYEAYDYEHTDTQDYTGQGRAQTFMQAQDGWCVGADLYFNSVGAANDVRMMIMEAPGGSPDVTRILAETTVSHASLTAAGATVDDGLFVPLDPHLLKGGNRYAISVLSQGNHRIYLVDGASGKTGGTMFHLDSNGVWQEAAADETIVFRLHFAYFGSSRVAVDMEPLQLTGGFTAAEIWAERIVPPTTQLDYEVQIGGQWYVLGSDVGSRLAADLSSQGSLLQLRTVFLGSPDLMPGVGVNAARSGIVTARGSTTLKHWSSSRPFGGSAGTVRVRARMANWDTGKHTLDIDLHDGAAVIEATTIEEVDLGSDVRDFIATFDLSGAPKTTASIIIEATTTDAKDQPYGLERRLTAFV